jgi:tRNA(fMet)-specific endonuclease VapC
MLDTNICGYIIRNKPIYIKEKLKAIEKKHTIVLSSIVVAEILFGLKKKNSLQLSHIVKSFLDNFIVYDFDKSAANEYAIIRDYLEKEGNIISSNDLFIASHAKSLNAILVTNNTKEFSRIKSLKIEDWIVKDNLAK